MAKKKHRKKPQMTMPLAVVAGFLPPAQIIFLESQGARGVQGGAAAASRIFLGYDSINARWDFRQLQYGFGPILMGFGIHKVAQMVGINRALAAARIPFIRI